jgi:hypothetical protein
LYTHLARRRSAEKQKDGYAGAGSAFSRLDDEATKKLLSMMASEQ